MNVTWKQKKKDTKSKKRPLASISNYPNLPFDQQALDENSSSSNLADADSSTNLKLPSDSESNRQLAQSFQSQGDKFAEDGKYHEALGKWEAALTLMPERAVLHEQKAQVLLEIGDAWNALRAATRAAELEPSWAEAWITLGRAQLNFGEPDSAIESFDRALALKPVAKEAQDDRNTALQLVKRRKQLHVSGLSSAENRFVVAERGEIS